MEIHRIIADYNWFEESSISAELIDYNKVEKYIKALPQEVFTSVSIGQSYEKRNIYKIHWGKGKIKVLLWGGMHGDEPTATAVFCDLCNYLQHPDFVKESEFLASKISIHYIPVLNPDGIRKFTRENAQGVDINRDFLKMESPEAKILKEIASELEPDFAFNLHNQDTLWSAGDSGFPATLSFLAPSPDQKDSNPKNRKKAIKVISDILPYLHSVLPRQIGKWDDAFEPKAFGDQFQAMGFSTILIEGGGIINGGAEKLRAYYFATILLSLQSIASKKYKEAKVKMYKSLPENKKTHTHILISNLQLSEEVDILLNYTLSIDAKKKVLKKTFDIVEIGKGMQKKWHAYQKINATMMHLDREISVGLANFKLYLGEQVVLGFKNGILVEGDF